MSDADIPTGMKFLTAGLGGIGGWWCIHPMNTLSVRLNLHAGTLSPGAKLPSFPTFASGIVKNEGMSALYKGIGAGTVRQIFYATSRFGLFEVFRDFYEQFDFITPAGTVGPTERLIAGLASGGLAAIISCPCEVTLVRFSNDAALPVEQRRNYSGLFNAATRIAKEEGISAFWRGCVPFANRAMLVGATQVGTFDQNKVLYEQYAGLPRGSYGNVFAAAMTSGLMYSVITMPFESAKNRMASQLPDPTTQKLRYTGTFNTIATVARTEGVLALWAGFVPYYCRCGGHTCTMFVFVEAFRRFYRERIM